MELTTVPSRHFFIKRSNLLHIIIVIAFAALTALPLFVVSSASLPRKISAGRSIAPVSPQKALLPSLALLPQGPVVPESIALYESTCVTPQNSFTVADTVCAKAAGTFFGTRRIYWVDSQGAVVQVDTISPTNTTATRRVGVSGTWRVYLSDSDGLRAVARFLVSDPQVPTVDLSVNNDIQSGSSLAAGGFVTYHVVAVNNGPDAASNVQLITTVPNDASLTSSSQDSGPPFTCTDTTFNTTCTIGSLASGASATFTFIYQLTAGTPVGTVISNNARLTSTTTELHNADNNAATEAKITGGVAASCTLDCPGNITVVANTTQNGNPGANVTFSSAEGFGDCGQITSSQPSGSFFPVGTTAVVVSSTTGGGSCTFNVIVVTSGAPTITCPADQEVTAPAGTSEATVDPGTPSTNPATGVSVSGQRSDNQLLSAPYPIGQTSITWTVTNNAGLTASCSQRITVNSEGCVGDTTAPTITAPPDVVLDTPSDAQGACGVVVGETELGTPNAQDNCTVNVSRTGVPAGNFFPVGTTTVTYRATDGAGNTATATQQVIISDKTPPVIFAPANASYTCLSDVPTGNASQATGPDVIVNGVPQPGPPADSCSAVTVAVGDTSTGVGSASSPRVITRTFTALDAAGNIASATQTITVIDATAPTISAPANASYQCASDVPIANAADATASDNCTSPTVTVSNSSNGGAGSTASPLIITRTFTATDAVGNSASASQTITVIDNTPPTITAPANATYQCANGLPAANASQASASDNCSTPTVTVSQSNNGGAGSSSSPLIITRTYTATDTFGNSASASQVITVIDNTPPSIALTGANPQVVECHTPYTEMGAMANDNCSGTTPATPSGSVNVNVVGSYTITYSAIDDAGNALTPITRTVNVVDTTRPVITRNGAASVTVECHTSFMDPGATASDTCDSAVPVTVSGSVNTNTPGTYTLVYNAVDDSGNTALAITRAVNVVDATVPTITVGTSTISMWPPNHKYKAFLVTNFVTGVSDSCQTGLGLGSVLIEKVTSDETGLSDDMVIAADCRSVQLRADRDADGDGRVYTITFRLRDSAGNTSRATARVVVTHDQGGPPAVDSGVHNTVTSSCP